MPANVDIAHDTVWLARRVNSVRIEVNPRLNGVETLSDATGRRIVEPQRLRPLGADRISVFELHQHSVRFKSGRLKLRRIQSELTRYEIDAAKHALIGGLSARNYYVSDAPVVAADRTSNNFKVKCWIIKDNIIPPIGTNVCDIIWESSSEIPAIHSCPIGSGQCCRSYIRARGTWRPYAITPLDILPINRSRNAPITDAFL